MASQIRYLYYHMSWVGRIMLLSLFSVMTHAADHNTTLYRPDEGWGVEGASGQLHVFGSLTESPCRIEMESVYQSVDMGNIETAELQHVGQKGKSVPFYINLQDCIETSTILRDIKMGGVVWSTEQPGVKARFLAPNVPFYPELVKVSGVQGLGLELNDAVGRKIPVGEAGSPQLLSPGENKLMYFITPVRIAGDLQAGAYRALISFELIYD